MYSNVIGAKRFRNFSSSKRARIIIIVLIVLGGLYTWTNWGDEETIENPKNPKDLDEFDIFETLMKLKPGSIKITEADLRFICIIREGVLICRLDKLCQTYEGDCSELIESLVEQHNPPKMRFALGSYSTDPHKAGEIIDRFLAAHSVWYITEEPYQHDMMKDLILEQYPVSIIRDLFLTLDSLQFHTACQEVWEERLMVPRLDFAVSFLSYGLTLAIENSIPFVAKLPNELFKDCPEASWGCYFLPLSNCTVNNNNSYIYKTALENQKVIEHSKIPQRFKQLLEKTGIHSPLRWWRISLLKYIFRPNYHTREMLSLLENSTQPLYFPCIGIHLPPNYKLSDMTPLIKDYKSMLEDTENIVVLHEHDISEEEQLKIMVLMDRPVIKYSLNVTNLEERYDNTIPDTIWTLWVLKLFSQCNAFIGSFDNYYSTFIFQYMCLLNGECPIIKTVDNTVWQILY